MNYWDTVLLLFSTVFLGGTLYYIHATFSALPNRIATHFNLRGKPDGWLAKETFKKWYRLFILMLNFVVIAAYYWCLSRQFDLTRDVLTLWFALNLVLLHGYHVIYRFNAKSSDASVWKQNTWSWLITLVLIVVSIAGSQYINATSRTSRSGGHDRACEFLRALLVEKTAVTHSQNQKLVRWVRPVRIRGINVQSEDLLLLKQTIKQINRAVRGSGVYLKYGSGGKLPEIDVLIVPKKEFPETLKSQGLGDEIIQDNTHFWYWWNDRMELTRAVILIDSEQPASERQKELVRLLTRSLGAVNCSNLFPDSVFACPGSAPKLSPSDLKILRFLYLYLLPGDQGRTICRNYNRYWNSSVMNVPESL